MLEKILKSLKQCYSSLGLGDEVLKTVAASLESTGLVTDENLETIVKGQEKQLKQFQSEFDKLRGDNSKASKDVEEWKKKFEELEKKSKTPDPNQNQNPNPTDNEKLMEAMMAKIDEKLSSALSPLSEKFTAITVERERKVAVEAAIAKFNENKPNPERKTMIENAIRIATTIHSSENDVDKLAEAIKSEYDTMMTGVGGEAYIPKDGGGGGGKPDFKAEAERQKERLANNQ